MIEDIYVLPTKSQTIHQLKAYYNLLVAYITVNIGICFTVNEPHISISHHDREKNKSSKSLFSYNHAVILVTAISMNTV